MKTNFKKIGLCSAMLFAGLYMASCSKDEVAKPVNPKVEVSENSVKDEIAGKKVFTQSISPTSFIEFHEMNDEVMVTIDGHLDEDPQVLAKVQTALQEKTLAGIYQQVVSSGNSRISVPQVLLDLDKKYNTEAVGIINAESSEPKASIQGEEGSTQQPTSARVDWAADAEWFKKLVYGNSPSSNREYHMATNIPWAWASRMGYYHTAFGMAASETNNARFRGWWENCITFVCSWDSNFDETIKARHWRSHTWRGSQLRRHRKFRVAGYGDEGSPEKRVHFGLSWSEVRENSDTDNGSTADLSAHITSYSKNNLNWYVKNNGTTTISKPWIKFTYVNVSGTGRTEVSEWQIPVALAPGQTYSDQFYANASSATIKIDSKNLIAESNEVNNQTSRTNGF